MPQLPREDVSWFEQVSPNLLRNKAIRQYFAKYTAAEWPELLKLTLLYGVLALYKSHGGKALTLDELRDTLARGHLTATLESALPDVYDQLDKLQGQLGAISQDIYKPVQAAKQEARQAAGTALAPANQQQLQQLKVVPPQLLPAANVPSMSPSSSHSPQHLTISQQPIAAIPAAAVAGAATRKHVQDTAAAAVKAQQHISDAAWVRRSSYPVVAPLPSAGWREGDTQLTWSPPGRKRSPGRDTSFDGVPAPAAAVYPSWWGDGSDAPAPRPASPQPARPSKPPPRLAYTVQQHKEAPLWQDDLVTTKYLDVPGSGYAAQPSLHHVLPASDASAHAMQDVHPRAAPDQLPARAVGQQAATAAHPFAVADHPSVVPQAQRPHAPTIVPSRAPPGNVAAGAQHAMAQGQVLYALQPDGLMMPVLFPVQALASDGGQKQQQQQRDAGAAARLNKKAAAKRMNLAAVESRIKAQVAADRAHARQQGSARQHAIMDVVSGPARKGLRDTLLQPMPTLPTPPAHGPTPVRPQLTPASPVAYQASPSELADSLASNPWTSWFMGATQPAKNHLPQATSLGVAAGSALSETSSDAAGPATAAQQPVSSYNNPLADVYEPVWSQQPGVPASIAGAWAAMHAGLEIDSSMSSAAPSNTVQGRAGLLSGAAVEAAIKQGPSQAERNTSNTANNKVTDARAMAGQPMAVQPLLGGMKWELDEHTIQDIMAAKQQAKARGVTDERLVPGVRPEVARWSKTWVGDFGHLEHLPRFDFEHPFQHHHQQPQQQDESGKDAADEELATLRARLANVRKDDTTLTSAPLNLEERFSQQQQQRQQQQPEQPQGVDNIRSSLDGLQARLDTLSHTATRLGYPVEPSLDLGTFSRPCPNLVTTGLPAFTTLDIMAHVSSSTSQGTHVSPTSTPTSDGVATDGLVLQQQQQQLSNASNAAFRGSSVPSFNARATDSRQLMAAPVAGTPLISSFTARSMLTGPSTDSSQGTPSHSSAAYPVAPVAQFELSVRDVRPTAAPLAPAQARPPGPTSTTPVLPQLAANHAPPSDPDHALASNVDVSHSMATPIDDHSSSQHGSSLQHAATAQVASYNPVHPAGLTAAADRAPAQLAGSQAAYAAGIQQPLQVTSGVMAASASATAAATSTGMSLSALAALARRDGAPQQQSAPHRHPPPALQCGIDEQQQPPALQRSSELQQQPPEERVNEAEEDQQEQQRREQLQQLLQDEDDEQQHESLVATGEGLAAIMEDEEGYVEMVETSSTTTEELLNQSGRLPVEVDGSSPGAVAQRESVGSADITPGQYQGSDSTFQPTGTDEAMQRRFRAWGTDSPTELHTPMSDGELDRITSKLSDEAARLGYQAYMS